MMEQKTCEGDGHMTYTDEQIKQLIEAGLIAADEEREHGYLVLEGTLTDLSNAAQQLLEQRDMAVEALGRIRECSGRAMDEGDNNTVVQYCYIQSRQTLVKIKGK